MTAEAAARQERGDQAGLRLAAEVPGREGQLSPRPRRASFLRPPSSTSPARSVSHPRNWACTTGQDARASATGSRSASTLGSENAATPTSSPRGWPSASPKPSGAPSGSGGAAGPPLHRADRATHRPAHRPSRPHRAASAVPGGERTFSGPGRRVQAVRADLPPLGADHPAGLLYQPLPQGPDPSARGARVPLWQHRPPAGDCGAQVDRSACPRRQHQLLSARRAHPCPQRDPGRLEELLWQDDGRGRRRMVRMAYEVATFQALRDRLRCKAIWVEGAGPPVSRRQQWCGSRDVVQEARTTSL
jgi:hypothetical protein